MRNSCSSQQLLTILIPVFFWNSLCLLSLDSTRDDSEKSLFGNCLGGFYHVYHSIMLGIVFLKFGVTYYLLCSQCSAAILISLVFRIRPPGSKKPNMEVTEQDEFSQTELLLFPWPGVQRLENMLSWMRLHSFWGMRFAFWVPLDPKLILGNYLIIMVGETFIRFLWLTRCVLTQRRARFMINVLLTSWLELDQHMVVEEKVPYHPIHVWIVWCVLFSRIILH